MNKKKMGTGLMAGGTAGAVLCLIGEILLYCNRLRPAETAAFTVVGSGDTRTVMVGIENWIPLMLAVLFVMALCLFLISIGARLRRSDA